MRSGSVKLAVFAAACVFVGRAWESFEHFAYAVPREAAIETDVDPPLKDKIAVINVAHVFKESKNLHAQTELFEKEIAKENGHAQARRDQHQELVESLKNHQPTTGEYRNIKEKAARLEAELKMDIEFKKKHFVDKQTQMYLATYDELNLAVRKIVKERGICLVVRFNDEPFDRSSTEDVFKEINQTVVFHDDAIDITDDVVKVLNGG